MDKTLTAEQPERTAMSAQTPRTDEVCEKLFFDGGPDSSAPSEWSCAESDAGEIADLARALERELSSAQSRIKELEKDVARFDHLQNIPAVDAQAFFWNYSSRKQRAAAIDSAMEKK